MAETAPDPLRLISNNVVGLLMDLSTHNLSNLYLYSWCLRQAVVVKLTV